MSVRSRGTDDLTRMSIRLELLQVARLARKVLGDSAELILVFLESQRCVDGGFKDRAGRSDLYYAGFGIDSLVALQSPLDIPTLRRYAEQFGNAEALDFVHLCSLIRCWAAITGYDPAPLKPDRRVRLLQQVERFRSADGGYHPFPQKERGTAYGAFLAMGAYQDMGATPPEAAQLVGSLSRLRTPDGGWANEGGLPIGATNATAAVVTVLRQCNQPIDPTAGEWLMGCSHPEGGFRASPQAPIPDLLSTATALHALSSLEFDLDRVKEACLDFVDSLWTNEGSFHGNWTDDHLDCEYTYYGLLALGHLA